MRGGIGGGVGGVPPLAFFLSFTAYPDKGDAKGAAKGRAEVFGGGGSYKGNS